MRYASRRRMALMVCTSLASTGFLHGEAVAQAAPQAQTENRGLEEIVVTAQKREQSMQDVPIAITALTSAVIQADRIYTVNDLNGLAPGLRVAPSAGGVQVPTFTMRGQSSYGVVAGSDKQVSIYIDGVYVSSPRGSIFNLPDVQRIEVLRGPQGTLFGRNATAGGISITTRDPDGTFGGQVEGSVGNHNQYRARATLNSPQIGPFSAYVSFVRQYQRGDIENAGAGTIWNRTLSPPSVFSPSTSNITTSPRYLGTIDSNSYFAAVKFEPTDNFKIVYKFDRNDDKGTPDGTAFGGYDPNSPLVGSLLTALIKSQPGPVYIAGDGKRPSIVNNSFAVPRDAHVHGHSFTATWRVADHVSIKNIAAYRTTTLFSASAIDGLSSLVFTPQALVPYATFAAFSSVPNLALAPPAVQGATIGAFAAGLAPQIGNRFELIASQAASKSAQYSDELQVNYSSSSLQLTAGALYFHSHDSSGGPYNLQNTVTFNTSIPQSGLFPIGNGGLNLNQATSLAAYAQLEYKIVPQLALVAGARITKDTKDAALQYGNRGEASVNEIVAPVYHKTKPNFLVGVNYTPSTGTLVYGKFSTSFVSGGSTVGVPYDPETVASFEAGVKADFLDHRLRTNLAVFHANYKHYQGPQSASSGPSQALAIALATPFYGLAKATLLSNVLGTFVADVGNLRATGAELEVTAAPVRGLTLGANLSYTDTKLTYINPIVLAANQGDYSLTLRSKWTGALNAAYETLPVFGKSTLLFRVDSDYRSSNLLDVNQKLHSAAVYQPFLKAPPYFIVNGRIALRHIDFNGVDAELAVWGKNLTNRRDANSVLNFGFAASVNYIPSRSLGADLSVKF